MKKLFALMVALVSILCFSSVYAGEPVITITRASGKIESPDFRNSYWGMTYNEVHEAEGNVDWVSYSSDPYDDVYYSKIGSKSCTVYFVYDTFGKLYKGILLFTDEYISDYSYITTFEYLVNALTEKYGEPKSKIDAWIDDYYRNNKAKWGLAVILGDLGFLYEWETEETDISLIMMSEDYTVYLSLTYEYKDHIEKEEEINGL